MSDLPNIIYSPIGNRGKNDTTILVTGKNNTPFWGYKTQIGSKIRKGDLILMCYAKEGKVNYIGRVENVILSEYICNKIWSKDKSVNTVKSSNKNWNYIVTFDILIKPRNLTKKWIRESFEYCPGWAGQCPIVKNSSKVINMYKTLLKTYPKLAKM